MSRTGVTPGLNAHIERPRRAYASQRAVLRPMRLVGNDDAIVTLRIGLVRVHHLIKLLNQREDVRLELGQQAAQVVPAGCPAWVTVIVHYAAAGECLVDLRIQVVAVGQDQEGKVALECAVEVVSQFPFEVIYGMISLCDSG
jgi:hypothetical protein